MIENSIMISALISQKPKSACESLLFPQSNPPLKLLPVFQILEPTVKADFCLTNSSQLSIFNSTRIGLRNYKVDTRLNLWIGFILLAVKCSIQAIGSNRIWALFIWGTPPFMGTRESIVRFLKPHSHHLPFHPAIPPNKCTHNIMSLNRLGQRKVSQER